MRILDWPTAKRKVLFVTGEAQEAELKKHGVVLYMGKPVDPEALHQALEAAEGAGCPAASDGSAQ